MVLLPLLALTIAGAWVAKADNPILTQISQADLNSVGLIYLDTLTSPGNMQLAKTCITDHAPDDRCGCIPIGHYNII